jgi:hypothetical protein
MDAVLMYSCKDCGAATEGGPAANGWRYMYIAVDYKNPINGWRCPTCVACWDAVAELSAKGTVSLGIVRWLRWEEPRSWVHSARMSIKPTSGLIGKSLAENHSSIRRMRSLRASDVRDGVPLH